VVVVDGTVVVVVGKVVVVVGAAFLAPPPHALRTITNAVAMTSR
jgi:hypothetical protein